MASRRPKSTANPGRVLTRAQLAGELDLDTETILNHHARPSPPPHDRRKRLYYYDAGEYRAWMAAQELTGEAGRPAEVPDTADIKQAKLRKENALASKYELEVKRLRGRLVDADEVKRRGISLLTAMRNRCIGLPAQVTPLLEGRDNSERMGILEQQIGDVLNGLAGDIERLGASS